MKNVSDITLGKYIANTRKAKHLTQEELSTRLSQLGVKRAASSIAGWETGNQEVPLNLLPDLARALELDTPAMLYFYAGVLENLPGGAIVQMLINASDEEIRLIEDIVAVLLKNRKNTG